MCLSQHVFVATKHVFCPDKSMLEATKLCLSQQKYVHAFFSLSRQAYFCRDKTFVVTKTFVATEMILIAAPANDRAHGQ